MRNVSGGESGETVPPLSKEEGNPAGKRRRYRGVESRDCVDLPPKTSSRHPGSARWKERRSKVGQSRSICGEPWWRKMAR